MKQLIRKILKEALKPSQYRKYIQKFDRKRYEQIFKELGSEYDHDKNFYRLYIPIVGSTNKPEYISQTNKEVKNFIEKNGYELIDYIKGVAKFKDSKNTKSIGKVLNSLGNKQLLNKFISDEERKSYTSTNLDNLMVVISRHPYDIAGSDTDRNWTNCMTMAHPTSEKTQSLIQQYDNLKDKISKIGDNPNLEKKVQDLKNKIENRKETGENVKYLINDVKKGSLISYLINKNDKNINNPLAVLNVKPYVNRNDDNDFILISDNTMYGNGINEFKKTIDIFLNKINGERTSGLFCLKSGIYSDGGETEIDYTRLDKINKILQNKTYKGNLNLNREHIQSLGNLESVGGYLDLTKTPIENLGNLKSVGDSLDLYGIPIQNLGNLKSVGGNLDLRRTTIQNLGNLESVGGDLTLERTPIQNLGNLKSVGGYLGLYDSSIQNLGNLKSVGDSLILRGTQIENLGNLESVGGDLYLDRTAIEEFGNLKSVGGDLDLTGTPILKKYTEKEIRQMVHVGGNIYIS